MSKIKDLAQKIDNSVGERIKKRRIELGLTQTDVAKLVGTSFQQLQKYEKGTNRVSASRLMLISWVLDVPVSYFFEKVDPASEEAKFMKAS